MSKISELIDFEVVTVAVRNIRTQKLRSLLTLLGVIIGIAAIVALVSISQGLSNAVNAQFESIGSNTLVVAPGSSFADAVFSKLEDDDIDHILSIQGVDFATIIYIEAMQVEFKDEVKTALVIGVIPEDIYKLDLLGIVSLDTGRLITPSDKRATTVGHRFANDLFEEYVENKQSILVDGQKFRVVGNLKKASHSFGGFINYSVVIPADSLEDLVGEELKPDRIMVRVRDGFDIEEVREEIIVELKDAHDGEEDFQVVSPSQINEVAGSVIGLIGIVLVGIAAISLVVGGVGIMNTMFMAVMERTNEIGVMKAIGATNNKVLSIFLLEAGLIGAFGGSVGIALGYGVAGLVSLAALLFEIELPLAFDPFVAVGVLLFSVAVGVVSGVSPALRASRLDPVEALRQD